MKIKKIGICDSLISAIMEWKSPRKFDILSENTIFDRKYLQKRATDNMDTFGYENTSKMAIDMDSKPFGNSTGWSRKDFGRLSAS